MKRFNTEETVIAFLESVRWPNGPVRPHCGSTGRFYVLKGNTGRRVRHGLRQCVECKRQFRVTVGTIFEGSHVPLHIWLTAFYLIAGAKKGMSALQLKRHLGLGSYETAWFMGHRIRHALRDDVFAAKLSGIVEVDETYVGGKVRDGSGKPGRPGKDSNKTAVVTLVQRDGNKRSMVMDRIISHNLREAAMQHVEGGSFVMTDSFSGYKGIPFSHKRRSVSHGTGEYVRYEADCVVHTNTAESSFPLLKRGVVGAFHHVSKKHLGLYLSEFDFRWNTRRSKDGERAIAGLRKTEGKRLIFKAPKVKAQEAGE